VVAGGTPRPALPSATPWRPGCWRCVQRAAPEAAGEAGGDPRVSSTTASARRRLPPPRRRQDRPSRIARRPAWHRIAGPVRDTGRDRRGKARAAGRVPGPAGASPRSRGPVRRAVAAGAQPGGTSRPTRGRPARRAGAGTSRWPGRARARPGRGGRGGPLGRGVDEAEQEVKGRSPPSRILVQALDGDGPQRRRQAAHRPAPRTGSRA